MSSSATIPGEPAPEYFYDPDPLEAHLLYQGEILVDVPILSVPKPQAWQLLRTKSGKRVHEALKQGGLGGLVKVVDSNLSTEHWYADKLGDYVMAVLDKRPALVLNQTCDIQTKDFIQVAPIFEAKPDEKYLEKLKKREIFSAFWIKKHAPEIMDESYADLELIQAVHKSYFKRISLKQHLRISAERVRLLQSTITRYFGRPNSFDLQTDTVPRAGTYLCVGCFYMDARITSATLAEGANFPGCPTCNGTQWVLKGH